MSLKEDIDDPVKESAGDVLDSAADTPAQSGHEEKTPGFTGMTKERIEKVEAAKAEIYAMRARKAELRAEKVAAAKALIAANKVEMERKKKEDAKEREKNRRQEGQSRLEEKVKKEREEMQKLAEDKRMQKIYDAENKKRIMERIALDKAEKKAVKAGAAPVQAPQPATYVQPASVRNYNKCRLQLRLPNVQPLTNTFQAEDTLGDVVAFIKDTAGLESVSLMTSFPRKQLPQSDYGNSLKSLGLCPSSVIIVSKCQ